MSRYGEDLEQYYPEVVRELMMQDNPLLRAVAAESAREGSMGLSASVRDLLDDDALSVRLAAFETLILLGAARDLPDEVRPEYEVYLNMQSDLPASRARYLLATDRVNKAGKDLRKALEKDGSSMNG